MPSSPDFTSRDGAIALAKRLQVFWKSQGHDPQLIVAADSAARGWAVRSNLTGREQSQKIAVHNPYKKDL